MKKYCILTGNDLFDSEGKCPIKKMCLNCVSKVVNDDDTCACNNENVVNIGRQKIIDSLPEGYEIAYLELKPMALKDPTKKCGNYCADMDAIKEAIEGIFLN